MAARNMGAKPLQFAIPGVTGATGAGWRFLAVIALGLAISPAAAMAAETATTKAAAPSVAPPLKPVPLSVRAAGHAGFGRLVFAAPNGSAAVPVNATESIRGSLASELCARCVVETGTSSFYSAIRDSVDEPVLKQICRNIAADEFRHYRLFYDHMQRYLTPTLAHRWQRLKVAITRFRETSDDEIASAYHAGNAIAGPYNRVQSTADYGARSFGFYQERHVRRAGHMFAQAAGFSPEGWPAKLVTRLLWFIIKRRGEKFRTVHATA